MARTARRSRGRREEREEDQVLDPQAEVGTGFETGVITVTTIFLLAAVVLIMILLKNHFAAGPLA